MKLNIIPTDEFIGKLMYCSRWYEKLKGDKFSIEREPTTTNELQHWVGNFSQWIRHKLKCHHNSSNLAAWIGFRDLVEALPGIHTLEFNGIDAILFKDINELLTQLEGIFKEVELESGKRIERDDFQEPQAPKPKSCAILMM